jgi:hypothetical protein
VQRPWIELVGDLLSTQRGLATRQELLRVVPRTVLDGFVERGVLRRVFPHVYTAKGNPATGDRRLLAALLSVGPHAALSHRSALALRGLVEPAGPVHVVVDHRRRLSGARDLHVHRRQGLDDDQDAVEVVRGLRVTALADSLVDAWPDLALLAAAAQRRPNIGGHRDLARTAALLADGVTSELEALAVVGVFTHRSLPRSRGQVAVLCPDGITRHHDRAWKEAMLAVELDGAAFHSSPQQRADDLARDAMFAAMGWLVLRFTYAEVLRDPDGVRAKVLAVYRIRVQQLRASA